MQKLIRIVYEHNFLYLTEEWVTRKKRDVTTTRQIATRVKRELVLEDGRILCDTGPKVTTSVNEDTHTTNFQQSEVSYLTGLTINYRKDF